MKILNHKQISQKTKRLAYQIAEQNYDDEKLHLLGINNNGYRFAQMLKTELDNIKGVSTALSRIKLSPANPLKSGVEYNLPLTELKGKNVIIVDDVASTGRTLFYALQPLMTVLPKKVEVAVLVNRKHKSFPIKVDYLGLSLATTVKENIVVNLDDDNDISAYLY